MSVIVATRSTEQSLVDNWTETWAKFPWGTENRTGTWAKIRLGADNWTRPETFF